MSGNSDSLFGTDGIRGRFGEFPFTPPALHRLGLAIGSVLDGSSVLFAMDTRFSGPEIQSLICGGIGHRCRVDQMGVMPTPGLSYLVGRGHWQYGLMITASHNPSQDNGVKLFNSVGEKISDELEKEISQAFWASPDSVLSNTSSPMKRDDKKSADSRPYFDFMCDQARSLDLRGLSILVDTANGAMVKLAPEVLKATGACLLVKGAEPSGYNINDSCGSQYPEALLEDVKKSGADWGLAFDGDGDRMLLVDGHNGLILDGDDVLYILARHRLVCDPLFSRTVVGTVMSNLGLESALRSLGIELVRADVGDRHVYQEMKRLDAELGGEPSGHVIIRSLQRSGDGLLTALHFFSALSQLGLSGADLSRQMQRFPQRLLSIRVSQKPDLQTWPQLKALEKEFQQAAANNQARLLIRYSGTENKIRLMVEADEDGLVDFWIERLEQFIYDTIGEKNETVSQH